MGIVVKVSHHFRPLPLTRFTYFCHTGYCRTCSAWFWHCWSNRHSWYCKRNCSDIWPQRPHVPLISLAPTLLIIVAKPPFLVAQLCWHSTVNYRPMLTRLKRARCLINHRRTTILFIDNCRHHRIRHCDDIVDSIKSSELIELIKFKTLTFEAINVSAIYWLKLTLTKKFFDRSELFTIM